MKTTKNILICPLEWGLGHAARMIPLAVKLRKMNHNVIVASGEQHLALFRSEIPEIPCIDFPGFKPVYSSKLPQYLSLLFKVPSLLWHIIQEHRRLKKIIMSDKIDIVISDNRFGLWNKNVVSVYVTHMPLIPFPEGFKFLEPAGVFLHRLVIKKYNFCFIPDLPGDLNLSGRLSHGVKIPDNVRFIGILSRFTDDIKKDDRTRKIFSYSVILSGPEPQREILKQKIIQLLKPEKSTSIIFEALPGLGTTGRRVGNLVFYSHLPSHSMRDIITHSKKIISRSGYTTIMELASLNCTATIIPTPGQTEQEYLALYLSRKGWFNTVNQNDIKEGFTDRTNTIPFPENINSESETLLNKAISEMLEQHHE